jgi:beta-glucosidase
MFAHCPFFALLFFALSLTGGCRADPVATGCANPCPAEPERARPVSLAVPVARTAGGWNERTTPLVPRLTTTEPQPRPKVRWWMPRFEQLKKKVEQMGTAEILFVGDSITEEWAEAGEAVWQKHFAHRALNLGVGGDRTQHILWRLKNGHLACGSLRTAVVLAGTNNLADGDSDADIFEGVAAIVYHLLDQCPSVRVVLMGILPREPSSFMGSIGRINALLAGLDNGLSVRFLDLSSLFLTPAGSLQRGLLPDGLHLSARGYRVWADALLPILDEKMSDPSD